MTNSTSALPALPPLSQLADNQAVILQIKRERLVPLFEIAQQQRIFELDYADQILHAQQQHLDQIHLALIPQFANHLSEIMHILQHNDQDKPKKFNRLQKWLGQDIEYYAQSLASQKQLKKLVEQIQYDSKRVYQQQQKSDHSTQILLQLRQDMAYHIIALQEFIEESQQFSQSHSATFAAMQQLQQRLKQRLQHLLNAQTSTDMALLQMLLNQDVATSLLARVDELLNVVLPSWQHYMNGQHASNNGKTLKEINQMQQQLLQRLQHAMSTFSPTSSHSSRTSQSD